ncbi:MAG TPA: TIM44-like domain-containing protein [Kofleriaceae bacterium]
MMFRSCSGPRRLAGLALLVSLGLTAVAQARPGGGDSFSGGGGHGGGGGGGAGLVFELIYWLIRIMFYYPQVGVPLLVVVVGYFIVSSLRSGKNRSWDSGPPTELAAPLDLMAVCQHDPAFSPVAFEDFAFRLYATAQRARHGKAALAAVAPYVGQAARDQLALRAPTGVPVAQVVVGAMRAYRVEIPPQALGKGALPTRVRIGIEYEANLATAEHTYYVVERWVFARDANVQSKPPGKARTFPCPNCGAPWQARQSGTQICASCGQAVDNGRFDWIVESTAVSSSEERPPTLTTEVPERGTELPTVHDAAADARWAKLLRDDPALTAAAVEARLAMIYRELNAAWANSDLAPVRGLVSEGLFDYLQYWIDAYQAQGLRNVLEHMRMTRTELAKVTRDRYYDAVTIRLWATGLDYVERRPDGALVRGSRHRERPYSEYWTLIRSADRKAAAAAAPTCGNCGAPLQISQSGECEHCGAHVSSGEFDWVVSKIEQDDTYRG